MRIPHEFGRILNPNIIYILIMNVWLCATVLSNMNTTTFNPLATILNQNKLVGSNYVDWKRNLDIVLTASGYKYVLTTVPLEEPLPDAPLDQKELYDKWEKDDEMARCYIQASMSSVLQHQHQSFKDRKSTRLNSSHRL